MLYAALTFWLLVIVFVAYGIYQLWSGVVKPRVINTLLLPGTLIAQLGHVVGLLITGGTVNNTTLIKDDDTGEPTTAQDVKPKIPIIGPIVVALLPMLACGFSIYLVIQLLGKDILAASGSAEVAAALPTTLDSFWDLLRNAIAVTQHVTDAILNSDFNRWQSWAFVYLIICLTVRMAPLPGTQRGAIGAIILTGLVIALIGMATRQTQDTIQRIWNILSFSIASLLFLLMVTLVIRGLLEMVRILAAQSVGNARTPIRK